MVDVRHFDQHRLQAWLENRVTGLDGKTWADLGAKLDRIGLWEFEDYEAG
jgi:hypothetical protein